MDKKKTVETNHFLSAPELLKIKGIGNLAWEDWQQSQISLPKTGQKYFEPNGSWLEQMQLDNGLKNRKRIIEIERVERHSQLAIAEWLPGVQRARVTKKSGQKWENFGYEEKAQLYLLPEEALILLEMGCLELLWNGMPLSIQQAYEVLIQTENSKCSLDEYRVYSQLVRWGYKLQRIKEKPFVDNKSSSATRRIIMNIDGLWTPNKSPTMDKMESNGCSSQSYNEHENTSGTVKAQETHSDKSSKVQKLGIVSEETLVGNIKIVKDSSSLMNQTQKWPGKRIQRNVKLLPKRNDIKTGINNSNYEASNQSLTESEAVKRKNSDPSPAEPPAKQPRPEVIELSDDEIEEIPRPMSRMEILNTLPNLASSTDEHLIAEVPRAYLPPGVKPVKEFYCFDRQRLLNLTQTDRPLRSNMQLVPVSNNNGSDHYQNGNDEADDSSIEHISNGSRAGPSPFYMQRSSCAQTTDQFTEFGTANNGFAYRGMRCSQRQFGPSSFNIQQQNVSIHTPFTGGAYVQSNYVNFVMEVMGSMVRSFRQQQTTTFCQNLQIFQPAHNRFSSYPSRYQPGSYASVNYFASSTGSPYFKRGGSHVPAYSTPRVRSGCRNAYNAIEPPKTTYQEEPRQPAFTKRSGVGSWSELKKKWREESTITIEDEEPVQDDDAADGNEVQVVESIKPLIDSRGIHSMSEVYEKLRIIKSATDRTVRSRKIDYFLSYDVFPANQHYKKATPGKPLCRLFVINSKKDPCMHVNKLQRLQQESKDVPVVVAFVSQSCISYIQPGLVLLPNFS